MKNKRVGLSSIYQDPDFLVFSNEISTGETIISATDEQREREKEREKFVCVNGGNLTLK